MTNIEYSVINRRYSMEGPKLLSTTTDKEQAKTAAAVTENSREYSYGVLDVLQLT